MSRMNKTVLNTMKYTCHQLLDQGHFSEVKWRRGPVFEYDTNEYLKVWGKFAFLVDQELKRHGYPLGCYEQKFSDSFRSDVVSIVRAIPPERICACPRMLGVPGG